MQIRSTKVFYFEKYFENTILFCIFKKLLSEYFILYFQITLIRAFYFVFSKYFLGVFCTSLPTGTALVKLADEML